MGVGQKEGNSRYGGNTKLRAGSMALQHKARRVRTTFFLIFVTLFEENNGGKKSAGRRGEEMPAAPVVAFCVGVQRPARPPFTN